MNLKKAGVYSLVAILIIAAVIVLIFRNSESTSFSVQNASTKGLQLRFDYLSKANTNLCAAPSAIYSLNTDYLQGSCCSPMDFNRYKEQIEGLKKYSSFSVIPKDPYNVSLSLAEKLLNYDNISLSSDQQAVYNEAVNLSESKGPCCCTCWRWYAFEGQAKYLITEKNFSASQIADVWNLEDGCGGSD